MQNNHLTYFKIENFKKFDSLEVNDIGQFNLIVGDNNVGKTCLLEAILIDKRFKTTLSYLNKLLVKRNIKADFNILYNELNKDYNFKNNEISFYQKDLNEPILINYDNTSIRIENKIIKLKKESTGIIKKFINSVDLFAYQKINHNSQNWLYFFVNDEIKFLADITSEYYIDFLNDKKVIPAIMLSDKIEDYIHETYSLIYKELDSGELALSTLNKLFPNIKVLDLRLFKENEEKPHPLFRREVYIKTELKTEYHSIREYGEGFIRSLYIIYLLLVSGGDRIIIDEIDTGIHHKKLKEIWKTIIDLCIDLDIQVFATTHSKECAEAYIEAAKEFGLSGWKNYPDRFKLIELFNSESKIKSFVTSGIENIEYAINNEPFRGENNYDV